LLVYFLEGFIFLVTGMQTRTLLNRMDAELLHGLAFAVLVTVVVVIVTRFICIYPAVYLPRWLSPSLAGRDPLPPWQWTFFLGFVGIRGVVSLAAALAIPLTTAAGAPFPDRELILFVTFGVIVVTLIGQGLLLPGVVGWLGLAKHAAEERQREHEAELAARSQALDVALNHLGQVAAGRQVSAEALAILRARHDYRTGRLSEHKADGGDAAAVAAELRMELIVAEREYIYKLLQEGQITDEARRRIERELDLEEASIACKKEGGVEPPL
jgi:CPA1 family monovalent cation:H+ antiporter